jgi:hypothetical protein
MERFMKKGGKTPERETLTEAYEVRAFKDEETEQTFFEREIAEITHAEPGAFEAVKDIIKGHGEQMVIPDDCQFGDNDLCYVDA